MKNDTLLAISAFFHSQVELSLIALDVIVDGCFVKGTRDRWFGEVKAVKEMAKRRQMAVRDALKERRSLDFHGTQVSGAVEEGVAHSTTTLEIGMTWRHKNEGLSIVHFGVCEGGDGRKQRFGDKHQDGGRGVVWSNPEDGDEVDGAVCGRIDRNEDGIVRSENGSDEDGRREKTSDDREHVSLDESRH